MLFRVDPTSTVPLGDQIAASVRRAVAEGAVAPGERLPAARVLAESPGGNVHRVLRGYQRLREEGLIELRRGRGAAITAGASPQRARLREHVREAVADARDLGMTEDELLALVRGELNA